MKKTTQLRWKKAMQALGEGIIGPFEQVNIADGPDAIREYRLNREPVMRMRVVGANTEKPGYECERVFEIRPDLIEKSYPVYVPTEKEFNDWIDEEDELWAGGNSARDFLAKRIAKKAAGLNP